MRWQHTPPPESEVERLRSELKLPRVCAELLVSRGIADPEAADAFLNPKLAQLEDPFAITNMDAVVARLQTAIRQDESVAIIGDYDVDGVTSTTLLVSMLRRFGLSPQFFVPRRLEEGYGLTLAAIDRVLEHCQPTLLIALDCGTNSVAEVAYLRQRGIDVMIIDHHRCKEDFVQDALLVNPHVHDHDAAPWMHLCTVGLVFKVVHALVKALREKGDPVAEATRLRNQLDLVAMGTVADLVPLREENRILTYFGLQCLQSSRRQGINALFQVSGLQLGLTVQPSDIAYRIGPRINASGRLADAALPVEMLLSEDYETCQEAAQQLDNFNRERQAIERDVVEQANEQVASRCAEASGIVVFGQDWHPGVVGIVAGKLARDYQRPCVVLGRDGENAVGSARSCVGINLQSVMQACDALLSEWGGHPMAVGVTMPLPMVSEFTSQFDVAVKQAINGEASEQAQLSITSWLTPSELNETTLHAIEQLRPFGEGNPAPVFGLREVSLRQRIECFGQNNCRFQLSTGNRTQVAGIAWRMADAMPEPGQRVDLAVRFQRREWNGRSYPQIELLDWRPAAP